MSRQPRLLITRPADDAEPLTRLLRGMGIECLLEPMLTIVHEPGPAPDLRDVQALLMTSANGARAFAARSGDRRLPVLAVGDATAQAARHAGFTGVSSAGGNVDDLSRLVVARLDPAQGMLLHVAGSRVAGDLATRLAAAGFTYRREALYRAETAQSLSAATTAAIAAGTIDGVLFFSPRTAATFVRLLERGGVMAEVARMDAFCLSAVVAEAARRAPWRRLLVAERPDQDSLLLIVQATVSDDSTGR